MAKSAVSFPILRLASRLTRAAASSASFIPLLPHAASPARSPQGCTTATPNFATTLRSKSKSFPEEGRTQRRVSTWQCLRAMASVAECAVEPLRVSVGGQAEPVEVIPGPGVSQEDLRAVLQSGPLRLWLDQVSAPTGILPSTRAGEEAEGGGGTQVPSSPTCRLERILVQGVDFFGRRPGFVKFVADVYDTASNAKLPGIVFARGDAVGVLMLLRATDEHGHTDTYAVLTEQVRVPVGRRILEMPAGMLDDNKGDFVGTAAREVEEETGIRIKASDLLNLTALLHPDTGRHMLPSPGGCDEAITLFLYRAVVHHSVIKSIQGRETGLRQHGELIRVRAVPYASLWRSSADCKVMCAVLLYEQGLKHGLIEDSFV